MNAYLDLSFIFNALILFTLPYYYKRISLIKFRLIEVFSLIAFSLVLYFNAFLFSQFKYLNLLFLLVYFLLVYQKKFFQYYVIYLFVYYSNIATLSLFSNNVYLYNCLVFLNTPKAFWVIFMEVLNIILLEIIFFSIRSIKLLKNYRTNIKIKLNHKYSNFLGYIDSGNTLLVEGIPVIFLKEGYFKEGDYQEMIVNGIGNRKCKYFKTQVIINQIEQEVICASGNKGGFKGCDCLVNIHLLKEVKDETTK